MKALCLMVRLKGGLGNQLFQYATARNLVDQNHIHFLFFDTERFNKDRLGRKYGLENFNVRGKAAESIFFRSLFRKNGKLNRLVRYVGLHHRIEEQGFVLHRLQDQLGSLSTLNGYWQSPDYFKAIRPQLLAELVPKKRPPYPAWINRQNTVAVHVRRTDYLQETRFGFLGRDYYRRAIELVRSKLESPFFVFFSDDIRWCEEEFQGPDMHFVKEEAWADDYLQLHLMSECKHQVIANSTFSWWAAWLNNNPDKTVIRPAQPFRDKTVLYECHYPDEWLAVESHPEVLREIDERPIASTAEIN